MSSIIPETTAGSLVRAMKDFLVDISIALAAYLSVNFMLAVGAAIWFGIQVEWHAGGQGKDFDDLWNAASVNLSWTVTLISGLLSALAVYLWRCPASDAERKASINVMRRPATWMWMISGGIAMALLSMGMMWAIKGLGMPVTPSNQVIRTAAAQYSIYIVCFIVLLAPFYEELLFRRVLFGRLWKAGFPMLGIVLSSMLFGLAHELPGFSANRQDALLLLGLTYSMMGAVCAWVYWYTGTFWAAVGAHMVNNAIALIQYLVLGSGVAVN